MLLVFAMTLSMAACVGQADSTKPKDQTTEAAGQKETIAPKETEAETEEPTTEVPETTAEPEKMYTVDEVPVPEELWEDEENRTEDGRGSWRYFIKRNLSAEILADYRELLIAEGFVITETRVEASVYAAKATQGNVELSIYFETADLDMTDPDFFKNGGAYCDSSIFEVQLFVAPEDVHYAEIKMKAAMPPLPEGNWSDGTGDSNKYSYYMNIVGRDMDRSVALDYVETVKAAGYTAEMEEYPEGNPNSAGSSLYYFRGLNEEKGMSISVNIRQDGLIQIEIYMRK